MPDEMFDEGVQALKAGQRVRAKELLTRLIKVDQSKPDYWLWRSAAVDSEKEQVFCLQNVLKLDPNLVAARRGQVVLGALRPEAAGLPPTNVLEDIRVAIPSIAPVAGLGAILADRRGRETLMIGGVGAVALVAVVVACLSVVAPGWFRPQRFVVVASTPADTQQARPSATVPVAAAAACKLPANPGPATRLAAYLCLTQPLTSLAAATEASVSENYTRLKKYYHDSDWTHILSHAHGLLADPNVPQSAHVYFYVAKAYRHTGDLTNALKYYQAAARKDTNFAPAFWGRAPDEVTQNKRQAALADFDHAILADSSFGASYLDRTSYYSISGNPAGAMNDLQQAKCAAPHNALVLASLALAFLDHGQAALGLDQAKSALSHDPGLALGYFARGRSDYAQATYRSADQDLSLSYRYVLTCDSPLPAQHQASVLYAPALAKTADNDQASAPALLSQAVELDNSNVSLYLTGGGLYMLAGRYDDARGDSGAAVGQLAKTAPKDPRLVDACVGLGRAWLALNRASDAVNSFQSAAQLTLDSFTANLGLGPASLAPRQTDAAVAALTTALGLASTPAEVAQAHFWRGQAYPTAGQADVEAADLIAYRGVASSLDALAPTVAARLTAIGPLPSPTLTVSATATRGPARSATPSPTHTPALTATTKATIPTGTPRR